MKVMKTNMHSQLGPWECILADNLLLINYQLSFCQVHSQADLFTGIHYYLQKLKAGVVLKLL